MEKKRIIVTGGSGKAGQWILKHFVENNYDVINLDVKAPAEPICRTIITDLNDLGQVHNAISQFSTGNRKEVVGIVHFAAIPQAYTHTNDVCFRNNVMSTYNILEAAANLGIGKVVLASSESSYGICFASEFFEPQYLPIDEEHPQLPEDSYGLSKVVNEVTAQAFHRRTGMQVVSFRLGNILVPESYEQLKANFDNTDARLRILWSYIDARDVASACLKAIEVDGLGAEALIIAADDSSSNRLTRELVEKYLPGVKEIRSPLEGRASLISNAKAKRLLGWEPQIKLMEQ
ncbi:NAD-dependent epimerase/dehydratase family protein [Paenibacillus aceris]|uniref:Nucleoside-diphosphate-sugar epimerase n=1 Tax=Paenibacillus aceris TaxID=869555 RepID=A0ABS4I6A6_9BACL|nr:NAD(P)-dependent oxidoreductase [Paenibacillus aceris]MBP1966447.1 nucleoside-diphosphate-sugar epimerase [Paenibacillus aceris]NHW39573.1 NAD(P)-dependent oxidoreductase [Paenibacillus aceris]